MKSVVVSISDCQVSANRDDTLITYALGSCIGVAIHDPRAGVGGLLHFMLPDNRGFAPERSTNAYEFARTGIPKLFRRAYELGADKSELRVFVAGGAKALRFSGALDIGKRNYNMMRKVFWKAGILIDAEDIGGSASRTLRLEVGSGRVWLKKAGGQDEEMIPGRRGKQGVSRR